MGHLAGDDPLRGLFGFRLFLFGCAMAALAVIWLLAGHAAPALRVAALVAWGWNPVVVVYGPQQLDTFVALLVLVGVWAWLEGRRSLGLLALAVATLTIVVAAPMLVVGLLFARRHLRLRWPIVTMGLLTGLGVLAVLPSSVFSPRLLLFLPGFLVLVALAGQVSTDRDRFVDGLLAAALYAAFLTPLNKPWYLLVLIGLVAVTTSGRLVAAGVVVCAVAVAITLLPLQPGVVAGAYRILWRLSMVLLLGVLSWAGIPLLRQACDLGGSRAIGRALRRGAPLFEAPT